MYKLNLFSFVQHGFEKSLAKTGFCGSSAVSKQPDMSRAWDDWNPAFDQAWIVPDTIPRCVSMHVWMYSCIGESCFNENLAK